MILTLSTHSPLNSVYTDEHGKAVYKVSTNFGLNRFSSISCYLPPDIPGGEDSKAERFGHLATVEHQTIKTSILHFGGVDIKVNEYFKQIGWGMRGKNRIFVGPDEREYKWHLAAFTSWLSLNDELETPVARFHKKSRGIIGEAHTAYLEIFPEGEGIVDLIMVTFIYIEKLRSDRENNVQYA